MAIFIQYSCKDLKESALTRPIFADKADHLPLFHLKGDIHKCPTLPMG